MTNEPMDGRQAAPSPPPTDRHLEPGRGWLALILGGAALAWLAVATPTTAEDPSARADDPRPGPPGCADGGTALWLPPGHPQVILVPALPPGHPAIGAWGALPPGHPPIGRGPVPPPLPRLPAGHPPVGPGTDREPGFPPGFMVEI